MTPPVARGAERRQRLGAARDRPIPRGNASREIVLGAGDVLYVPRGYVHECAALDDDGGGEPSVHLTLALEVEAELTMGAMLRDMFGGAVGEVLEAAERGVRLGELRQFHAGRAFDAEAEDIYDAVAMWEGGGGADVGVFVSDSLHQIWAWEQHALDGRLSARGGAAPPEAVQVHAHDVQFVKRGDAPIDERRWEDVEMTCFADE